MTSFRLDPRGMGEFLCGPEMQKEMRRRADLVLAAAVAAAPVAKTGPHRGRYKASLRAESGVRHQKTARAYGRVIADSPEGSIVEYGARATPRYRILGRALAAARG